MPRRPKLVLVVSLVPTKIKEELQSSAYSSRRSLSSFIRGILTAWVTKTHKNKMEVSYGNEKEI